ncbi:LPXTG cell wall anchor domain-containing protein, partial [Enterococcus durans]
SKKNVRWFPKTNDSQQKGLIVLGILLIFLAGGVMVFKWKEKQRRNK